MKNIRKPRILNVDDNAAKRYAITHILRQADFEVQEAVTGKDALLLAEERPDLILLDVNLPDISGFEVCRQIRANPLTAAIPIVHLSATFVGGDDRAAGLEQGADGYLTQPVEPKVLVATINAFLRLKAAEQALRESEERFRITLRNSFVMVFNQDRELHYTWMHSPQWGIAPETALGKTDFELLPAEDAAHLAEIKNRVLRTGVQAREEVKISVGGHVFFCDLSAEPLRDAGSDIVGVTSVLVDITERHRANNALVGILEDEQRARERLMESESRFKQVSEDALEWIWEVDKDGLFTYSSSVVESLLGFKPEEIVGTKHVYDLFAPDNKHDSRKAVLEVFSRKGGFKSHEIPNIHKDGQIVILESSGSPIVDKDGNLIGYRGVGSDITERKRAEASVRESELRFRSVWNNSADGIRLTDRDGHILDVNEAYCKLVKMPREELVGQVFSIAYQSEGPSDDLSLYQKRFDAGATISNLLGAATLRSGERVDLEVTSSFIEIAGEKKMLLSLFRDVTERKQAEKRIQEERNLLRTIIDAIPDEIAVKDTERRFIVVNSGAVNALKRASADEIIGKQDEDLVPEHLVKDWREEEKTVLAGGKYSMERVANKINPETGEIERSLLVSKTPLKDHEGKIIGLVGINRDITALKQAEEMLEKERTLLLTLIENIPDEVCLKDLRHRYLTANRAAMKALGMTSLEALIGKTDKDFAPQGLAQEHCEEEEAILESGEPLINRERIKIDPDTGQVEKCLLTTKVPVKDNTGATIGILVVNRHITERKQMEELLRASEEKFRALFEESKDLVYFSTGGGKLLDINPAGIELLGYASKQEILSIDLANEGYADSEDKRRFDRQMAQHGFVKDYEVVLRRKDGGKVTVLETATAVMDNKGNVVQYRGVMRDVTKQRQLERQFLQAQKMDSIGTLAGGIAHDFNNILGIILGHLALLERTRENVAQFDESVFSINRAVERGASLVRQILTFARKTEAELEPVNINLAAKELAKMVEETFPKLITVTLRLDKTIPVVSMDPTQLHQALLNLCVNARDAMSGQGTLTIATHLAHGRDVSLRFPKASSNHYVHVSVSDTGTGMDEEIKQRIFEPFFTTKEKGKGTGLGLAVVFGVLQAHNGFIDVESTPGAGSTFHLFVPVPEGIISESVKEAVKNEDLPGGTETILVVEDEDVLRDLLTRLLEMHGYTVISAADGEEAVRRFSEHEDQIDLLLSDMGLPKRSGWDAFKLMQKTKPGVRALLASGYIEPGQKSEILKSGVRRFISKPYRMEEVLKAIRETLDEKE